MERKTERTKEGASKHSMSRMRERGREGEGAAKLMASSSVEWDQGASVKLDEGGRARATHGGAAGDGMGMR